MIDAHVYRELGLKDEEFEKICGLLGREPTPTELAMFSVEWSEHCGYPRSRPLLKLLTLPFILLTLGLFTLIINAFMLWLTGQISQSLDLGFYVHGFWSAFWGGVVVSIVNVVLGVIVRDEEEKNRRRSERKRSQR